MWFVKGKLDMCVKNEFVVVACRLPVRYCVTKVKLYRNTCNYSIMGRISPQKTQRIFDDGEGTRLEPRHKIRQPEREKGF
jgi:hypothetical protein